MIWQIQRLDSAFLDAFEPAGTPDQRVIDAYVIRHSRNIQPQERQGVKRWYYLLKEDHRVSLVTVGMPLEQWIESKAGAAFLIVGTREIIGEFESNKHLTGRKGLQMKMQPLLWMHGRADRVFMNASECLATLSEQILDLPAIERSQEQIRGRYQWKDDKP